MSRPLPKTSSASAIPKRIVLMGLVALFACQVTSARLAPESGSKLINPAMVNRIYAEWQKKLCWYPSLSTNNDVRQQFLQLLDSCSYLGLVAEKYHYSHLKAGHAGADSAELIDNDRILTDAIISFCKDVYQGADINNWIISDEISGKYEKADDDYLIAMVKSFGTTGNMKSLTDLEPSQHEYITLKQELRKQILLGNENKIKQLTTSINLYRWIYHFKFDKCIVVNIASATLRYYEQNNQHMEMRVVAGKPATKSPRFATWCYEVVLYPYWNVPRSIATKELFPRFKRNPGLMKSMNMQVIGRNGKVIDPASINWAQYDRATFPYSFRQCTGCDNSLGVIKFNLTDPFHVYLHDTNYKIAFLSDTRFLSHGCIRVEKPIELGNHLLNNKLDSNFLKACLSGEQPIAVPVKEHVPVFVVYMTAEAAGDSVSYNKDIYKLYHAAR